MERKIRIVYGKAAEEIILFEDKVQKNEPEKVMERIEILQQNWGEIIYLINNDLPSEQEIIKILQDMDAPWLPEQVGIDEEMLYNSILYAKDIRNRYGLLQILFDLGTPE